MNPYNLDKPTMISYCRQTANISVTTFVYRFYCDKFKFFSVAKPENNDRQVSEDDEQLLPSDTNLMFRTTAEADAKRIYRKNLRTDTIHTRSNPRHHVGKDSTNLK